MKRTICFLILLLSTISFQICSSQTYSEGLYEGKLIKYEKNSLLTAIKVDSLSNTTYMNNVNSFLSSINASIDIILDKIIIQDSISSYACVIVKLNNDTMDAINYISILENSGFFHYTEPNEATIPIEFPLPDDQ